MKYAPDVVIHVIDALRQSSARYILTGSLASNLYTVPRSTIDADFAVDMTPKQLEQLFERLTAEFEREPQMAFETVTGK